jgi:hypothetical protein
MAGTSKYEESKALGILDLVAGEAYSLSKACQHYDVLESTFRSWCKLDAELDAKYARAREDRAHKWAEELVEIPDSVDITGDPQVVRMRLEQARQKVDTRKWVIARILAKLYGDKIVNQHEGKDGGALEFVVRHIGE